MNTILALNHQLNDMNDKMPESLKGATNAFVDELQKHTLATRLRILISLVTSEISTGDPMNRDLLATYVIVGVMEVLNRMNEIHQTAKLEVEDLLEKVSKTVHPRKHQR